MNNKLIVGGLHKLIVTRGIDVIGILSHSADGCLEVGGSINVVTFHPDDIRSIDGHSIRLYPEYWRKHDVVGDYGYDNMPICTKGIA